MRRRALVGGLAVLGLAVSVGAAAAQTPAAPPFAVDLPSGFTVEAQPPGPDFQIYILKKADVPYVGVYAGNFPQFAETDGRPRVDGGPGDRVRGGGVDDSRVEYLIHTGLRFPAKLHVWSMAPPDPLAADRLAASVRALGR